jgi:hypothetical protein
MLGDARCARTAWLQTRPHWSQKTAKSLALTIPAAQLVRANEVVE